MDIGFDLLWKRNYSLSGYREYYIYFDAGFLLFASSKNDLR